MTTLRVRLILLAAIPLALTACSSEDASETAPASPEVLTLPDGTEATAAQQAYLDQVQPHLSPANENDTLGVLDSGEISVCGIWKNPSSLEARAQAVPMLLDAGYDRTEATVIYDAAVEHLCPEK
ncbi:hypothetical protein E9529_13875 [Blastococcus sp. KM273128]|uniref:DUF732 domain-containing protein n=1 Tax=Blastococcus sp. KM273128 TaxID=2570314 RepID=UPI001F2B8118|nr:DUF732 domain-containing protein [Blastococcus sp. KM273128]MCF6745336.1 hypothetical protein [Blastococcus sp. KM273128]